MFAEQVVSFKSCTFLASSNRRFNINMKVAPVIQKEKTVQTWTCVIVNFLIKTCIIPLSINNGDKLRMKIFSMKTLVNFVVMNGVTAYILYFNYVSSWKYLDNIYIWMISFMMLFINSTFANLPLILAFGFDDRKKNLIVNSNHKWPKEANMVAIAFLINVIGLGGVFIPPFLDGHMSFETAIQTAFQYVFYILSWFVPPFVTDVVLGSFIAKCKSYSFNHVLESLENYSHLLEFQGPVGPKF